MSAHDPRARYCVEIVGIPASELRDDLACPACDEMRALMHLDPDMEVLSPDPSPNSPEAIAQRADLARQNAHYRNNPRGGQR